MVHNTASTAPRGERVYRNEDRSWVGAPCTQQDATLAAQAPAADDPRWQKGTPTALDKRVQIRFVPVRRKAQPA